LKDALSEVLERTGKNGSLVKESVASSSRLIALFGGVYVTIIYTAIGLEVMFNCAAGRHAPRDLDKVEGYLWAGLAFFAPYAANRVSAAFNKESSPSKPTA
jgi:hypothetical protein